MITTYNARDYDPPPAGVLQEGDFVVMVCVRISIKLRLVSFVPMYILQGSAGSFVYWNAPGRRR